MRKKCVQKVENTIEKKINSKEKRTSNYGKISK